VSLENQNTATLFVVGMPIGNPLDITLRALKLLKESPLILAEDTRVFKNFCRDHGFSPKKVLSYGEHNEVSSAKGILKLLEKGQDVVLTTDAGTPGVSDPGFRIVELAVKSKVKVQALPGPSSLTAALSLSPIGGRSHYFGGFPPTRSKQRLKVFKNANGHADRMIFFEAPHRLQDHLTDALAIFGNIAVALFREITKPYEEVIYTDIQSVLKIYSDKKPKGEFVLIYKGQSVLPPNPKFSKENVKKVIKQKLQNGIKVADIFNELRGEIPLKRKDLYQLILQVKNSISRT
jgi:16S rRNA (cytidine1402-2'-O)-methyltransferase